MVQADVMHLAVQSMLTQKDEEGRVYVAGVVRR